METHRIRFTNTVDDLVEWHRYHHQRSPAFRNLQIKNRWISTFIPFIGFPFYLMIQMPLPLAGLISTAGAAVTYAIYPWTTKRRVENFVRKVYAEPNNHRLFAPQTVELTDSGIHTITEAKEARLGWQWVDAVEVTDKFGYIYIGGNEAFVIPMGRVSDGDETELLAEATRRLAEFRRMP